MSIHLNGSVSESEKNKGKAIQKELDGSFCLLQTIIDHIPGGVVKLQLCNDKIVPVYISDGWCQMMKDTRENLMAVYAKDAMAGLHPDDYAKVQVEVEAAIANIKPINCTYRIRNSRNEYLWVNNRSSIVPGDDGTAACYAVYTNVSEEVKVKSQQKISEEKLMAVMEHTNIMFWEFYFENNMCVNGFKSIRDLGMPKFMPDYPECVIESGFVHPDSAAEFRMMHEKLKSGAPSAELDIKVTSSEGQIEWKKVKYTTIYNESGLPVSALGTSEDITEQVLLSKRYKDSVEYYHNSIDERLLITGHCNITQNRILEIVSSSGRDYVTEMGENRELFFTRFAAMVVGEEKQREFLSKFLNTPLVEMHKNGVIGQKMECLISMGSGNFQYVSITIDVMKEPTTGELTGFFAVADITAETIYKKAINSIVDHYYEFIVDVDARADTYTMLSQKRGLTNIPPSKGIFSKANRKNARGFADAESTNECLEKLSVPYILKQLEQEDTYSFNFRILENGAVHTKKIQVFLIDQKTQHIGFTQVDVTELLDIEQQKNEALTHALTSAERANKAKTDFLSRMSHDIRTPMNAILGMTELTMQELDDKAKAMENLTVIDSSGKLLLSMINDLLDMSRIESGSLTLVRETFDCDTECQNLIEMSKVMFEQKQQSFSATKCFAHRYFVGDIIRLKRVIFNLLNNAAKFTPNGGSVSLRATEQQTANPKIALLAFEVSDSGIGIPKDKIDSIFEPFTQLDTEAKHQGTGLGLSIVKSIVETKGGTITVKSEVRKGTVFTVTFPMEIAQKEPRDIPAQVTSDSEAAHVDFSRFSILLVEDHPVNTMVAKRLLEKHGATVDTAENGEIAYEKFTKSKTNQYNLIFMDIQMPVMNGYESARAIRSSAHPQAKTVPIIAMTANAYAEDIKKATDSGMNGHIAKPISMDLIVSAICAVIKNSAGKKENSNDEK